MNDHDLIHDLRAAMRARTDRIEVPDGFVDAARRTARRRSARRAATAGAPLLAAAGVATVLATGGGSGSASSRAGQTPRIAVDGLHAHNTAFIVTRVKARLADDSGDAAFHVYLDPGAREMSDGSLVNLGRHRFDQYVYDTADGDQYQRTTDYGPGGRVSRIGFWSLEARGRPAGARVPLRQTTIDTASKTYESWETPSMAGGGKAETQPHGMSGIEQALRSGDVTQLGTTTIDGSRAIALALHQQQTASGPYSPDQNGEAVTLYVDAHTYDPLRTVTAFVEKGSPGLRSLYISDELPVTADTIAKAKDESIPDGFTEVPHRG